MKQEDFSKIPNNINSGTNPLNPAKENKVQPLMSTSTGSDDQLKMKKEEKDLYRDNISKEMQELTAKVKSLMTKGDKVFYGKTGSVCRECGKEGSSSLIKSHIEVNHIDGLVIACNTTNLV